MTARTQEARKAASEAIMAARYGALAPIYQSRGLILSVEATELDGAGMTRRNSLRERAEPKETRRGGTR